MSLKHVSICLSGSLFIQGLLVLLFLLRVAPDPEQGLETPRRTDQPVSLGAAQRSGPLEHEPKASDSLPHPPERVSTADPFPVMVKTGCAISGRILDTEERPLSGARVELEARPPPGSLWSDWAERLADSRYHHATTDATGRYLLVGLAPHEFYTLTARHAGAAPAVLEGIALGQDEVLEGVDLHLPHGGTVRGRVVDEFEQGIAAALVLVQEATPDPGDETALFGVSAKVRSDQDGNYAAEHLPPGVYVLRAESEGRSAREEVELKVSDGETIEGVTLGLDAGELILGRVVDEAGRAVPDAIIRVAGAHGSQVRTDGDGEFSLAGLHPQEYSVAVRKVAFETLSLTLEAPNSDVVITLRRGAEIAGSVRSPERVDLPGFGLKAMRQTAAGSFEIYKETFLEDTDGRFVLNVRPGIYRLLVAAPGFLPTTSRELGVRAGEQVEGIVLELQKGVETVASGDVTGMESSSSSAP